jgi:ParB-like chromosome segregation protein Spo0J
VVTPDGAAWASLPRVDNAIVKALARAFRWRSMLDDGTHATLERLARARAVNATYVSGMLRLTLLAPDIVEAILDGRQPQGMRLENLLEGLPAEWDEQRAARFQLEHPLSVDDRRRAVSTDPEVGPIQAYWPCGSVSV